MEALIKYSLSGIRAFSWNWERINVRIENMMAKLEHICVDACSLLHVYICFESFKYIENAYKYTSILIIVALLFVLQDCSRSNNKIKLFVRIHDGGCMKRTMFS